MCADSYLGIKDIFKNRDETSSKETKAKERKIIKEEVEAATALLIAGEFEHEILNDNAAIIVSEKKNQGLPKELP